MATVKAVDLIAKFQYALDNDWGYIWGKAGVLWTQAMQNAMNKTTSETYKYARMYGKKWIGHYVADCSGLFYWAFKQLGGYMYHGSDTMWNKYCTAKGALSNGKRTDKETLKPGTAVFTYNSKKNNRGHVGLYVGNGKVIEASGTQAGVCTSNVSDKKWVEWGELKGVDYKNSDAPVTPTPEPKPEPAPEKTATVIGTRLALRSAPSTSATILMRVNTGEKVELLDDVEWVKVKYDGKTGYMMSKYLQF